MKRSSKRPIDKTDPEDPCGTVTFPKRQIKANQAWWGWGLEVLNITMRLKEGDELKLRNTPIAIGRRRGARKS